MRRSTLTRIIALLLAIAAAVLLYVGLIAEKREEGGGTSGESDTAAENGAVSVVVAACDIPEGTVITAEHLKLKELPVRAVLSGAYYDMNSPVGMIASSDIRASQQITRNDILSVGDRDSNRLALIVEPGMRAIPIAVSTLTGVNSMLLPGDSVDVTVYMSVQTDGILGAQKYEMTSMTLLEDITVLAVDRVISKDGSPDGYSTVTLMVTPEDANRLIYVTNNTDRVYLTLRSPLDSESDGANRVTDDNFALNESEENTDD